MVPKRLHDLVVYLTAPSPPVSISERLRQTPLVVATLKLIRGTIDELLALRSTLIAIRDSQRDQQAMLVGIQEQLGRLEDSQRAYQQTFYELEKRVLDMQEDRLLAELGQGELEHIAELTDDLQEQLEVIPSTPIKLSSKK